MIQPPSTPLNTDGETISAADVSASANRVIDSLHEFVGVIGRIQQGIAEIDGHALLAQRQLEAYVGLAESRIDAHIQQRMSQVFQAGALDMDQVEKELRDRRRRRVYSGMDYDEY